MHQCAVVMDRQLTVMSDGGSFIFNDARAPGSGFSFMPSSFIVTSRLHHPVCCVVCGTSPTTQCAVWNWKLGGTWCLVRCRWGQLLQSRFSQSVRVCTPAWPSVGLIASLTILDAVPGSLVAPRVSILAGAALQEFRIHRLFALLRPWAQVFLGRSVIGPTVNKTRV